MASLAFTEAAPPFAYKEASPSAWNHKPFKTAMFFKRTTKFMVKPISFHPKPQKDTIMESRCFKAEAAAGLTDEFDIEDAEKALIRIVANTNRGKNTTPQQRKQILKMINVHTLFSAELD